MPESHDGKSARRVRLKKPETPQKEIHFTVDQPAFPENVESGLAFYAAPEGISVILDIDDTLKDSNVLNRKALLRNTFLNEYKAVAGIESVLDHLREKADVFHYVSASPIQLYPALREFFTRENFPRGSFHLRETTDLRDFIPDTRELRAHKRQAIERLFSAYPQRKFILVGDTGESDPEIYAEFKRKYPARILEVIFHDITQEGRDSARFRDFTDLSLY
jgi:phosphatidate phosphatase APP1